MSPARKQWLRILAEGAAIVVSILLAFFIDAQWNLRQERDRANAVLSSLEAAYSENLAMTEAGVVSIESDLAVLRRFLNLDTSAAGQVPPDSAADMIGVIYRPGPPNPNNDFVLALLDAESLNRLSDLRLREAIAQWRTSASSIANRRLQLRWSDRDAKRALGQHPEIRPVLAGVLESPRASPAALLAALQDDDVMALASAKANDWRVLLFLLDNHRRNSEAVLATIQQGGDR